MYFTNEMTIKFETKENAKKALDFVKAAFNNEDFYGEYKNKILFKILEDLKVKGNNIELGDGINGYLDPEDSKEIFADVFETLASSLTLVNFEAEASNLGDYTSSLVTATFKNGNYALRKEYWGDCDEDGDSECEEISKYFF